MKIQIRHLILRPVIYVDTRRIHTHLLFLNRYKSCDAYTLRHLHLMPRWELIIRDRLSFLFFLFLFFFLSTDCQARLDGSLIIAYASTTFMLVCAVVT